MSGQLTLDGLAPVLAGARTCPGCQATYGEHSQYARDETRTYCYAAACTIREAPRVIDEHGHQCCPSCGSQLRRGWYCAPCDRVGATAPTLLEGASL